MAIGSESVKIKSRKLNRMSFCENFTPLNFLAIRYTSIQCPNNNNTMNRLLVTVFCCNWQTRITICLCLQCHTHFKQHVTASLWEGPSDSSASGVFLSSSSCVLQSANSFNDSSFSAVCPGSYLSQCTFIHGGPGWINRGSPVPSLVTRKTYRKSEVKLDFWAFLFSTELFERANQIVACPILVPSACADANWW